MWILKALAVLLVCLFHCVVSQHADKDLQTAEYSNKVIVRSLRATQKTTEIAKKNQDDVLDIFCYQGNWPSMPNRILQTWTTVNLRLSIVGEEYELFKGENRSMVYAEYRKSSDQIVRWWVPWRADKIAIPPFNETCIGILTQQGYNIKVSLKTIDPVLMCQLILGILLFLWAGKLSKNVMFYYGTGISFGVLASLLIVVFIMSRFLPWKKAAYVVMFGGWSFILGGLFKLGDNLRPLLETQGHYVIAYIAISGVISFAVCYYYGPVSNPRSLNLIKWSIQAVSTALIYFSCQLPEVSLSIIFSTLIAHNFPRSFNSLPIRQFLKKRFPGKRRFLTEKEYMEQADETTREALDQLRQYCRSPNCDAWQTISKLQTPQRFAKWVEGDSHLSDDEISFHMDNPRPSFSEDESESEIDFRMNSL